ncbi:MAG TPA: DUF4230 domain-containing protein [Chthoniobacteraceae bacterium]|nr:DUF4230 domain-containing protein [Chthoniobacteraceae bacterium]
MSKSLILRTAVALCLVMVTATLCVHYLVNLTQSKTEKTARSIAGLIEEKLNFTPLVTVDRTVVFQESTPVMELVSLKKRMSHQLRWSSTQFHSTKEIVIAGDFSVSVGFDLKERFSVSFDSKNKTIYVVHPAPKVLSMELLSSEITHDRGWWNAITDHDQTTVLNSFHHDARKAAEGNAALLDEARRQMREQLLALLTPSGFQIEFQELGAAPVHIPSLP